VVLVDQAAASVMVVKTHSGLIQKTTTEAVHESKVVLAVAAVVAEEPQVAVVQVAQEEFELCGQEALDNSHQLTLVTQLEILGMEEDIGVDHQVQMGVVTTHSMLISLA
jgi:hypothetical protein